MTAFLTGLGLGLIGGGHCMLMCGPLLAIVPRGHRSAAYHVGRILTYLVLGAIAGVAGAGAAAAGLGRFVAVSSGVALIATAMFSGGASAPGATIGLLVTAGMSRAGERLRTHPHRTGLLFGALNGLLPCGLVYSAFVAALGFGRIGDGFILLLGFGAGTVFWLTVAGTSARLARQFFPPRLRRTAPVVIALVGLLLIARGVGIPHLSVVPSTEAAAPHGH